MGVSAGAGDTDRDGREYTISKQAKIQYTGRVGGGDGMWREVLRIIEEIGKAKGKEKHPLIINYLNDNELFKKVVQYTLDTSKVYHVSKVGNSDEPDLIGMDLFEILDKLDKKGSANDNDKKNLSICASTSQDKLKVTNIILSRKLRCGITTKTLHKLIPGTVPYFPYMRCSSISKLDRIKFPCFSQLKADGMYVEVLMKNGKPTKFRTRNGKELILPGVADWVWPDITDCRLCGELLLMDENGDVMPRKDSNAIINTAMHGLLSRDEADRLTFQFWDMLMDVDEIRGYQQRFNVMGSYFTYKVDWRIQGIPTRIVQSIDGVWRHYEEVRADGFEGTILKNFHGKWKDGTSMDQVKLKAEKECELQVYDIVPGKGKYRGMIGALRCKSACGWVKTDIGMGLDDSDRVRTDWIGKIITVRFNEISKSKNKNTWALSHARLIEERRDKDQADDFEYIKKVKEVR